MLNSEGSFEEYRFAIHRQQVGLVDPVDFKVAAVLLFNQPFR
jgi:hypothetical protein